MFSAPVIVIHQPYPPPPNISASLILLLSGHEDLYVCVCKISG